MKIRIEELWEVGYPDSPSMHDLLVLAAFLLMLLFH